MKNEQKEQQACKFNVSPIIHNKTLLLGIGLIVALICLDIQLDLAQFLELSPKVAKPGHRFWNDLHKQVTQHTAMAAPFAGIALAKLLAGKGLLLYKVYKGS